MNKIGFQNFRRFLDFEPIEYKGITFLVGRNNAGKSTLVKALLLLNDFFKSENFKEFSFGNNVLEDANIVSFGRAKNSKATEDLIKFIYQKDNYYTEITLTGDEDKTYAEVFSFLIRDIAKNIDFLYESTDWSFSISRNIRQKTPETSLVESIDLIKIEIERLKKEINESKLKKSSREYILLVEEYNSLNEKINQFTGTLANTTEDIYSISGSFEETWSMSDMLGALLHQAESDHDKEYIEIQKGELASDQFETNRAIKQGSKLIEDSFEGFFKNIKSLSVIYLGANSTKQSALFPIRDRSNALAQSIHDFYQLRISDGEPAYEFVEKWMKEFEVGDSFEIENHAGEAYEVKINSNNTEIHLADKGMGSIQAMLLILRLACIIHKTATLNKNTTVLIEEPELNLHPALQSRLADLFLEVNQLYKLNFIVETHSEYILRKSQVLVLEKEFEVLPNENPFCVYYFPKEFEAQPYRLEYQKDGRFNKNFGEGFFDEATNSTKKILKHHYTK